MTLIENILLSWFDLLGYTILALSLLERKISKNMVGIITVFSIPSGVISYSIDEKFTSIILILLVFLFLLYIFRISILRTLCIYAISTVVLITIQGFLISVANLLVENINDLFVYGITIQIIGITILLLLVQKIPFSVMYRFILSGNRVFLYLISNLFALAFALLLTWHFDRSGFIDNFIVISLLFITIIMINVVILNNGLKNRSQESELRTYKMYSPVIESLMDEIKARQHEFDNHIQALNMKFQQYQGSAEIDQSISQIKEANRLGELAKMENKLVSGLIYSKILLSDEKHIEFNVKLKTYALNTAMKEYELVEIIGILVDNAFETEIDGNKVYLEISDENETSIIRVLNKHPYLSKEDRDRFFEKGNSSKGENRGYGLFRLKSICKKHKADIVVDNIQLDGTNYVLFEVKIKNG